MIPQHSLKKQQHKMAASITSNCSLVLFKFRFCRSGKQKMGWNWKCYNIFFEVQQPEQYTIFQLRLHRRYTGHYDNWLIHFLEMKLHRVVGYNSQHLYLQKFLLKLSPALICQNINCCSKAELKSMKQ